MEPFRNRVDICEVWESSLLLDGVVPLGELGDLEDLGDLEGLGDLEDLGDGEEPFLPGDFFRTIDLLRGDLGFLADSVGGLRLILAETCTDGVVTSMLSKSHPTT